MNVVDERKKGPRRRLSELMGGEVVQLDDRPGFWETCISVENGLRRVHDIEHGANRELLEHTEITLVTATVTITDG